MDEPKILNEEQTAKSEQNEKKRVYAGGKIVLDSKEFEALVDAFRTLLEWSNDLKTARNKPEKEV